MSGLDYKRNGTATLFAALIALDGRVLSRYHDRRQHQEWLRCLRVMTRSRRPAKTIHLIVANYAIHKHSQSKTMAGSASLAGKSLD